MSPSLSSPSPPPVTTLDEPHTRSVESPTHICLDHSTEHSTPHHNLLSSSGQSLTQPLLVTSSRSSTVHTISALQSKIQPSPPSQNMTMASISINSDTSCLTPSDSAPSLHHEQPAKLLSQSLDSSIVDSVSSSVNSRHSITPSFSFPGASSSVTTYDRVFLDSTDSERTLTTVSSTESISTACQRMPNVYINGLPPHFSEQDLFALTRPFGDIKSVRTFTRHVSEKPTGYGFVLFNDADSAQRCIEGLRKYRNLHPSFSKQVHRIPGTEYAQHNPTQSTNQDENTFKARMEKLKDVGSTNLYVEGLPLSIDEESLSALMSPYKIKSSRFFKTKLSNPPRIIAFVRLETRTAAEETIERLHGRMVRGWNDPGCRISVRFADSAEQRELRRAERTLKSGDQSPSRLTIAQAALLNLRGQELQANTHYIDGSRFQCTANMRSDNQAASFAQVSESGLLSATRSFPSKLCYRESPLLSTPDLPITPEIHNMSYDGSLNDTISSAIDNEYLMTQQTQLRTLTNAALLSPNSVAITLPRGHAQARNGFTPAEELILEAHAQRLQFQAHLSQSSAAFESISSSRKLNSDILCLDPVSRGSLPASGLPGRTAFSKDTLSTISEDDFHTMSHPPRRFVPTPREFRGLIDNCAPNITTTTSTVFARPQSRAVTIVPPPPDYEEPGRRSKGHHQRAERPLSKQIAYSSSFNIRQPTLSSESKPRISSPVSTYPNDISKSNDNTNTISRDKNNELQHTYIYSQDDPQGYPDDNAPHFRSPPASQIYNKKSSQFGEQHSTVKEGPKSPAIVSPALTYSSRTPSTLSPATPFFGSFTGNQNTFEVMAMENEDVAERKLKAKAVNK